MKRNLDDVLLGVLLGVGILSVLLLTVMAYAKVHT